jgi:(p)ppGpp synthase/HD superfamily hydrolase
MLSSPEGLLNVAMGYILGFMERIALARLITFVAHTACGQKRADNVTPYISHPARVAELVQEFYEHQIAMVPIYAVAAAWLHDVLEDTKLTRQDLIDLGVDFDTLDIVERLTKKNGNELATPEYYQGIADSEMALFVKAADRCSNLEDALSEVNRTSGLKRWKRYVEKTRTDVLPMYVSMPYLRSQIESRLEAIEEALEEQRIVHGR